MDCRAFDALKPTLLALTGILLLVTPACDGLALTILFLLYVSSLED